MDLVGSPPVPLKKTLVLVNAFIVDTTRFLNHFSTLAEEKLYKVSRDITRVETSLLMLESRLAHVEGLEDAMPPLIPTGAAFALGQTAESIYDVIVSTAAAPAPATPAAPAGPGAGAASAPPAAPATAVAAGGPPSTAPAAAVPADAAPAVPKMREHPSYAKFYKLASMNLDPANLKLRMTQEGLRPELLDTPDAPITAAGDAIAAQMAGGGAAAPPQPPPLPAAAALPTAPPVAAPAVPAATPAAPAAGSFVALKDDPVLAPLFKMLKVGTPMGAVQHKARLLGVDPSLLERDPDGPSPLTPA